MTDITHTDLEHKLTLQAIKTDKQHAEVLRALADLQILIAGTTAAHGTHIESHAHRLNRIEDRNWQVAGGALLGLLGFISSCAIALLSFR